MPCSPSRELTTAWAQNTVELGVEFKRARDTFPSDSDKLGSPASMPTSSRRPGWYQWISDNTDWSVEHVNKFIRVSEKFLAILRAVIQVLSPADAERTIRHAAQSLNPGGEAVFAGWAFSMTTGSGRAAGCSSISPSSISTATARPIPSSSIAAGCRSQASPGSDTATCQTAPECSGATSRADSLGTNRSKSDRPSQRGASASLSLSSRARRATSDTL